MQGHTGRLQGPPGDRGSLGKCRQEPVLWFPQGGMGEVAWAGLELASMNNFSGPWGRGSVPLSGTEIQGDYSGSGGIMAQSARPR